MKFEEYNITNNDGKSNCVIRSFCKMFNESYNDVYNELCRIQKDKIFHILQINKRWKLEVGLKLLH